MPVLCWFPLLLVSVCEDNTGGPVSWSFYDNPKKFARVALCGQISEYENESRGMIPNPFKNCIYTSVKIQGKKAGQSNKAS